MPLTAILGNELNFILRIALWLAGLVFFLSLLAAASLVLLLWLVRALWAKLTGQAVRPWTFSVNRQAMWRRFEPESPRMHKATAGRSSQANRAAGDSDVIDVEPKRMDPIDH